MKEKDRIVLEAMTRAVTELSLGKLPGPLADPTQASDRLQPLLTAINRLIAAQAEAGGFLAAMAQGQLNVTPPPRNHLIAPFKQLHANLRHLVWQTKEVAQGDYSQRVDFLGDFAEAFNEMIEGLREKKRLQAQLRQAHDELEIRVRQRTKELNKSLVDLRNTQAQLVQSEKMASLGQLAAGVAHEINNPIGFVSSNLNTLAEYQAELEALIDQYRKLVACLEKGAAAENGHYQWTQKLQAVQRAETRADVEFLMEDARNLIQECRQGARRIAKIVTDLKQFAQPGADGQNYVDLNACMEATLNVVRSQIKHGVEVKKSYGDLPLILCYPQQVGQVFMHLVINAAQAIEEKGRIEVSTRRRGEHVEIIIRDDGAGIAEENLSKVYDAFFTTKPVGKGSGLGLNVVYNIIKKHNGLIDVESRLGHGSTFTLRLPITPGKVK